MVPALRLPPDGKAWVGSCKLLWDEYEEMKPRKFSRVFRVSGIDYATILDLFKGVYR